MLPRLNWFWLPLFGMLGVVSLVTQAEESEKAVTFSHVYRFNSGCKQDLQAVLPSQDQASEGQVMTVDGEKDIVFKHKIKFPSSSCTCADSEEFKALLYRVNGLEEEVTYLKTQCAQGCCGGSSGVDTSCSGHGVYQQNTCSCKCDAGWEGPDCSISMCPDNCNNNGYCVDGRCVCHAGYTGHDCGLLICPDDCNDKGHCVDGKCVCFEGFSGDTCSMQNCPSDCKENGRCIDGNCHCDEGFFGNDCSMVLGPKGLHVIRVTDVSLLVEWERVKKAEYYLLYYYPHGNEGAIQEIRVPNTENSYLITGLKPGVTYIVQVQAVVKGISSESDRITATTDLSGVEGVRVLGQTEDSIQVDWKNPETEVDYFKLRHASPDGHEKLENVARSQEARTVHTIIGLNPGTEYQITVQAIKGSNEGKPSHTTGVTDIDSTNYLVTRDVTETTVTVIWEKVRAEVDGYILTYSSAEGSSQEIQVGADATSYQLTSLKPGVLYTIFIRAYKGSRLSRNSSTEAETELDAPTNLLVREVTEDSAMVSWDRVQAEIDGYILSYSSADGSSDEVQVGADSTSYQFTGLRPGVTYTVYVWAIKGSRSSRKTTTETETEIDAPKNLKAVDVKSDSAALTWTPPQAQIDGYVLSYRPEDGSMQTVEKNFVAGDTTISLSGLATGKKYVVTLIAYRGSKRSKVVETIFITVEAAYHFPMDCTQIMKNGKMKSGVYTIYVANDRNKPMQVYCDMTTDGGGWLVFQRRNTGKLDFMKRWRQYTQGFGELTDEFWLGLENIHALTNTSTKYEVRFDLGLGSERAYAVYDDFKVGSAKQKFKLTIGNYRGNAGDAMAYHQGRPFTTIDSDNDIALGNCAFTHHGAWWYKNCHLANLNGKFEDNRHSMGVNWEPWKGHLMSLDYTEIMIRPVNTASRKKRSLKRRAAA
ncbi:tenascin-N isoform X2 [Ictalurus punctatus]|uniref:Tenascin-N isoform X2 n=1 Tax=Ictalurus punctatus TaxID=7998 RepID=A0A2D0RCL9_ICTPU|nr:tenascin-N isoform X2 [Ictalurus punctatus]